MGTARRRRHLLLLAVIGLLGSSAAFFISRGSSAPPIAEEASASASPAVIGGGEPAPDPMAWTSVSWEQGTSPFSSADGGLARIDGMVNASGIVAAWGRVATPGRNQFNDMGAVALTTDGRTWQTVVIEHGVGREDTSSLSGVAVGAAGYLAWGGVCCATETHAVWTSPNGADWTRVLVEGDVGRFSAFTRVVPADDGWLALGMSDQGGEPAVWTSVDGSTWTMIDPTETGLGPGVINDVAVGPDGLVAVGTIDGPDGTHDGGIWTSPDGRQWHRIGESDMALAGAGETELWRVVPYAGGLFVTGYFGSTEDRRQCEDALGKAASLELMAPPTALSCGWGIEHQWVSPDGERWTRVDPEAQPGLRPVEFRVVAAGGPGLLNLGESSGPASPDTTLFVSEDGVSWTAIGPEQPMTEGVAMGLVAGGNRVLAVVDRFDGQGSSFEVWLGSAD
jgi:hypothetical protein